jgi:hypothetical protein
MAPNLNDTATLMRLRPWTIFSALCALAAGCATVVPPPAPPAPQETYVAAPFDTVWQRAVAFFANSRVPIQAIEKGSGLIASTRFQMPFDQVEAWADCGNASTGGSTIARLKAINNLPTVLADFNVLLRPVRDSTAVRVNLGYSATVRAPAGMVPLQCVTNGTFESALTAYVSESGQ